MQFAAFFTLALCALDAACGAWHWWMVPMAAGAAYGVSWGWKYGRA